MNKILMIESTSINNKCTINIDQFYEYLIIKSNTIFNTQQDYFNVNIFNIIGETIKTMYYSILDINAGLSIDISILQSGIYFIKIGSYTEKFIILR